MLGWTGQKRNTNLTATTIVGLQPTARKTSTQKTRDNKQTKPVSRCASSRRTEETEHKSNTIKSSHCAFKSSQGRNINKQNGTVEWLSVKSRHRNAKKVNHINPTQKTNTNNIQFLRMKSTHRDTRTCARKPAKQLNT